MSEFETEEQVIVTSDEVNINWNARTILTPSGLRAEIASWGQVGMKPPAREIPEHYRGQVYEIMHTFGPSFHDGSLEAPFKTITFDLADSKNAPRRTINVGDFVFLGLESSGEESLARYFPDQRYIQRVGGLVSLQFHTVAHIFGQNTILSGRNVLEIRNNTLYLPRSTSPKPKE
jgi:hypothetical protein